MNQSDREFYKKHEVRIGEDFQTSVPYYYSSLDSGFRNYFNTFLDVKDKITHLTDLDWDRKAIGFNFGVSFEKVVTTIVDFHRFFELAIKDILGRINPLLKIKIEGSAKQLIDFHLGNFTSDEYRTVEFGEAKNRLKHAIKYLQDNQPSNKLIEFEFLTVNNSGIEELSWWRNRLIHNGTNIPNILALDYLITQKVIPLVSKVIEVENKIGANKYTPYYFNTKSGIKIIERIENISFYHSDFNTTKTKQAQKLFTKNIIELYHLKALGRASMNFRLNMNINNYIEYHKIDTNKSNNIADYFKNDINYHKISDCICCSNTSLITYKESIPIKFNNSYLNIVWAICTVCDYGVSSNLGNPKDSNITSIDIFK